MQRGRRRVVHRRPRRGRRDRRRVGVREVGDLDDLDGPDALAQRVVRRAPRISRASSSIGASNEELRRIRGERIAMIFQDPMSSLDPVYRIGTQIAEQIRVHDKEISKAAALRPLGGADGAGRHSARARPRALLPARVLGRHAPARDDRDGAVVLAEPADRRRADDRARRHDPGPDPRRAARAARRRAARGSSSSPTTSAWSPTSPTGSSSCTPVASSSRARSTSSSTTPSTPTRGVCSARSRGSTATARDACRRSPGCRRR